MENFVHCRCKTGCRNKRCVCLKNNEPCDDKCTCVDCQNPLNGVNVDDLSTCALQNIEDYHDLSQEELEEEYELSCGCEQVPLSKLIGYYSCSKCGEGYRYSLRGHYLVGFRI